MSGTTSIDSLPISQMSAQQQQPSQQSHQQPQQQPHQQPQQQPQQQMQMQMQYTPENIRLETSNMKVDNPAQLLQQSRDNDPSMMQKNMSQFVSGIQQASAAGMTSLPSRDIPQNQDHLIHDQHIKPNYIPSAQTNQDYISNYKTSEDIIRENRQQQHKTDSFDAVYNELQIPLLISVLYFLFQLPVVRKNMVKYIPLLFNKDGNPNLSGYVTNSILFGLIYYAMTKFIQHFSL
jgi:hypothetical protein